MFGKRNRALRRQRALEELLWLDPVERERRALAAVASGDFTAAEVEASLRLVSRLEGIRAMDLPGSGRLIGAPPVEREAVLSSDEVEVGMVADTSPDASDGLADQHDEQIGIPIYSDAVGIPVRPDVVGIPVRPEHEAGADGASDSGLPLDALESAQRWISREQNRTRPTIPAIGRRAAEAAAEWTVGVDPTGLRPVDEAAAPTISWLRPN